MHRPANLLESGDESRKNGSSNRNCPPLSAACITHIRSFNSPNHPTRSGTVSIPVLLMRHREVKQLRQRHQASRWHSQDSNRTVSDPRAGWGGVSQEGLTALLH